MKGVIKMSEISGDIGNLASFIGSLTIVGSALIWIYNKFIGKPRERKREEDETKRHARMIEVVTEENKPLNETIKQLSEWLDESKVDRENLNKIALKNTLKLDEHEKRLDRQQESIIILETLNGIKVKFKGGE